MFVNITEGEKKKSAGEKVQLLTQMISMHGFGLVQTNDLGNASGEQWLFLLSTEVREQESWCCLIEGEPKLKKSGCLFSPEHDLHYTKLCAGEVREADS